MILDKDSIKMLDLLAASPPDKPRKSYSYDYICQLSGLDEDDMFPVVKNLVANGLAEYAYSQVGSSRKDAGIALTQAGLKRKEIQRLERRERWKERIIGFVSGVVIEFLAALLIKLLS